METLDNEDKDKDDFETSPLELIPENYEGCWGDEFIDPQHKQSQYLQHQN